MLTRRKIVEPATASGADPATWCSQAEQHTGSRWPRWADWLLARSGVEKPAPTSLGGTNHPVLEPAPGRYVHEK